MALNEEFCVMFNSRLNEKRILFGAEMDGVASDKLLSKETLTKEAKFVEVKTHRHIFSLGQEKTFRQKTLKWFCQSYLVGVENVFVGFRNQLGIVDNITKFKVLDMPTRCVVSVPIFFYSIVYCACFVCRDCGINVIV